MSKTIIWLHEKSLSTPPKLLSLVNEKTRIIYVWDNEYFKNRGYSLKRLVFIYQTLCELPVEIIKGDTLQIFQSLNIDEIITPYTNDLGIRKLFEEISKHLILQVITSDDFVNVDNEYDFKRFFKYWNKAKKTAFLKNGIK